MPDTVKYFHAYNGTKLEYSPTQSGTYARVNGLKTVPDIGGEPNEIDTTCLDNTEYESAILGLKPVQKYTFEFNMEDPTATANIKLMSDLEDAGTKAFWRLTLSNGIKIEFQSKVVTTIKGGSTGDLIGFDATLTPEGGVVTKTISV